MFKLVLVVLVMLANNPQPQPAASAEPQKQFATEEECKATGAELAPQVMAEFVKNTQIKPFGVALICKKTEDNTI